MVMRCFWLFLFFLTTCFKAFSVREFPPEILLDKTFFQRYYFLEILHDRFLKENDSLTCFSYINEMRKIGELNNDRSLVHEADMITVNYMLLRGYRDSKLIPTLLNQLFTAARNEKNRVLLARVNRLSGDFYWEKNYELSFEHYHAEHELIKNMSFEEYPAKQAALYFLGEKYWQFKDYQNSIRYLTEAIKTEPFGQSLYFTLQATNTIGLCYQKMNNLDSADYYFLRANAIAKTISNEAWDGITSGNLGYNFYLRGLYDTAVVLLQKDIDLSILRQDWGCASGAMVTLAEISILHGNLQLAEQQAKKAEEWVRLSQQYVRYNALYPLLGKLNKINNRRDVAELYYDSANFVKDSLKRSFSALQTLRWQHKIALQEKREKEERLKKNVDLIAGILMAFFSAIILLLVFKRFAQSSRQPIL